MAGTFDVWLHLGRLRLVDDPRVDRLVTLAVLAMIVVSRWVAFPASIWDIDEAIFARSIVDFDPASNYPHPPFFPLWILLIKAPGLVWSGLDPTLAPRLVSAAMSVWMLFPLVALWSTLLDRRLAVAAALVFLFLPLPWILSGRGYTGTAAAALLTAAAAHWLRRPVGSLQLWAGGVMAAASVLVRPQLIPVVAVLAAWRAVTARGHAHRLVPVLLPLAALLAADLAIVTAIGDPGRVLQVVGRHGAFHFGALSRFDTGWWSLSIVRGCGPPIWGLAWLALSIQGLALVTFDRASRPAAITFGCTLVVPVAAITLFATNPTFLRYAVPYFAVTSGFVVATVARVLRPPRLAIAALATGIAALAAVTAPHLGEYRHVPAPVIQALDALPPLEEGRVRLVADRSLMAFLDLRAVQGRLSAEVIWSSHLGRRSTFSADDETWAILDDGGMPWRFEGRRIASYSCTDPWIRRFVNPRLIDVLLVEGLTSAEIGPG